MIKYLKLMRVLVWPASLFSFAVGFESGARPGGNLYSMMFGFLAMFSFLSFAYALNFYADRDVDRYDERCQRDTDRSKQPLLTGEVTEKECIVFCILTFLTTILLSALVNRLFALLMFYACVIGGILYSHPWVRLKAAPLGDILCMTTLSACLFSAGYALSLGMMPTWLMLIFFSLFSMTIYIPTVVIDYEYDLKAGLRTSAVVFGQRNLIKGMAISCLFSLPVAYWIVFKGLYPLDTKILVVFSWGVQVIYTAIAWKSLKPPRLVLPLLNWYPRQVIVLFGLIPMLFIGYGFFIAI